MPKDFDFFEILVGGTARTGAQARKRKEAIRQAKKLRKQRPELRELSVVSARTGELIWKEPKQFQSPLMMFTKRDKGDYWFLTDVVTGKKKLAKLSDIKKRSKPKISKEEGQDYVWTQKGTPEKPDLLRMPLDVGSAIRGGPKKTGFPRCPNCGAAYLEQHRRKTALVVCPLCWHKYEKEAARKGVFKRVKKKVKRPGWAHPRGY